LLCLIGWWYLQQNLGGKDEKTFFWIIDGGY
jgi:hypothetical protein